MKTILLAVLSCLVLLCLSLGGQDLRPIRDDVGYGWHPQHLERLMTFLKENDPGKTPDLPLFIAGISPHDDYLYAGKTYYTLFKRIKSREIVIFGVTHGAVRKAINDPQGVIILDSHSHWTGPYGPVQVSGLREAIKNRLNPKQVIINNTAHQLEHSIEGMIPFLQYFNRDVVITPIMVTGMEFDDMERLSKDLAGTIASYIQANHLKIGEDIFFLISADANHYGKDFDNAVFGEDEQAHELGTGLDKQIATKFLSDRLTPEKMKGLTTALWGKTYRDCKNTVWCGKYSIPFGLLTVFHVMEQTAAKAVIKGAILDYSDTYSGGVLPIEKPGFGITAPFSLKHWVGFFSAGFYLE